MWRMFRTPGSDVDAIVAERDQAQGDYRSYKMSAEMLVAQSRDRIRELERMLKSAQEREQAADLRADAADKRVVTMLAESRQMLIEVTSMSRLAARAVYGHMVDEDVEKPLSVGEADRRAAVAAREKKT